MGLVNISNFNRVIKNVDADILNGEQKIAYNILSNHLMDDPEEPFFMIVTGGFGTGKRTLIKDMCARVNEIY